MFMYLEYICMYTHIYMKHETTINEKESMNLKEDKEWYMGGRNDVIILLSQNYIYTHPKTGSYYVTLAGMELAI